MGKSGLAMLQGLDEHLSCQADFLAVVPEHKKISFKNLTGKILEAKHPIPDATSFAAGKAVADYIASLDHRSNLLVLISGGTSSLVALPCSGLSNEEKAECHRKLIYSGLPISDINSVRRKISAIKGGKLLYEALNKCCSIRLMAISDVDSGLFHDIGSGPFSPDPEPVETALQIAERVKNFPQKALNILDLQSEVFDHQRFLEDFQDFSERYHAELIFSQRMAEELVLNEFAKIRVSAAKTSVEKLHKIFANPASTEYEPDKWLVACGENEIKLPEYADIGIGGRASHNLLQAAISLARSGVEFELAILATDGKDGNSGRAGGYITSELIDSDMLDEMAHALKAYDSSSFLFKKNLAFSGFCSETNVGDIYLFRRKVRQ
jgi:glycerate-2-kinase